MLQPLNSPAFWSYVVVLKGDVVCVPQARYVLQTKFSDDLNWWFHKGLLFGFRHISHYFFSLHIIQFTAFQSAAFIDKVCFYFTI